MSTHKEQLKEFKAAILNNDTKLVKKLLASIEDIPSNRYPHIVFAAKKGYVDILQLLLNDNRFNPSINDNTALIFSADNGKHKSVKLLLKDKRVDPAAKFNWAISNAYDRNDHLMVDMFWKEEAVKKSLQKDEPELYNKITTKYIKDKIVKF